MIPTMTITVNSRVAADAIRSTQARVSPQNIQREVGAACVRLTQTHLRALGPNKRGWPTSGFYAKAARGTAWEPAPGGLRITVDNDDAPGSMRQRYHGGTINMKDKRLAIPARQEFYGHSPTEFTNLRLAIFKSGAMALMIGQGGVGQVNFGTGKERNVKGAGARTRGMVAYWLRESVTQEADPDVLPTEDQYTDTAILAVARLVTGGRN